MAKLVIEVDVDHEVFEDDTSADVATVIRDVADAVEATGVGYMQLDGKQCRVEFEGALVAWAWVVHKSVTWQE